MDLTAEMDEQVKQIAAALDKAEEALKYTTSSGPWGLDSITEKGLAGRDQAYVLYERTGDNLARCVYPADARHIAAWQPSRIKELISDDRKLLDFAVELSGVSSQSTMFAKAMLSYLTHRWVNG